MTDYQRISAIYQRVLIDHPSRIVVPLLNVVKQCQMARIIIIAAAVELRTERLELIEHVLLENRGKTQGQMSFAKISKVLLICLYSYGFHSLLMKGWGLQMSRVLF